MIFKWFRSNLKTPCWHQQRDELKNRSNKVERSQEIFKTSIKNIWRKRKPKQGRDSTPFLKLSWKIKHLTTHLIILHLLKSPTLPGRQQQIPMILLIFITGRILIDLSVKMTHSIQQISPVFILIIGRGNLRAKVIKEHGLAKVKSNLRAF